MKSIVKKLRSLAKKEQGQPRIDVLDEQHHNKMMIHHHPIREEQGECRRAQQHHLNSVLADQKQSSVTVSCDESSVASSEAGESAVSRSARTTNKNMGTIVRALGSGSNTKEYYYRAPSMEEDDNDDDEDNEEESSEEITQEFTSSLHNHYKPSRWGNHIQKLKARGLLVQEQ